MGRLSTSLLIVVALVVLTAYGCGKKPGAVNRTPISISTTVQAPAPAYAGPAPLPAPAVAELPDVLELRGISDLGAGATVNIFDLTAQRGRWLKVGDTSGDLQVVSADPVSQTAVVKVGARTATLQLVKPTGVPGAAQDGTAAAAADGSAPGPSAPGAVASTDEDEKAREARMFVSDLLEIGMQQRKAFEERQSAEIRQQRESGGAPAQ